MDRYSSDYDFFEKMVAPLYPNIIRFLMHASNDPELTDDIAQDTMEAAWKYRKRFRLYNNIEAVLITTAKNKLKKHYLKTPESVPIDELEYVESDDKALDYIVMEVETGKEMRELLRMLDEKYARVVILHYYYKLSLRQIANMYGIKYNTVRSWHNRAISKLRKYCIKNEGFESYINKE